MKVALKNKLFYLIKPVFPRPLQIMARRWIARRKQVRFREVWPIHPASGKKPLRWPGWPENKKFAFVLTHDVEFSLGHNRCKELAEREQLLGMRSAFNFVPERYPVSAELRKELQQKGFEIGVHGLNHDGMLYFSEAVFKQRAKKINEYLRDWGAAGFRSPAMHHNLDWIHQLNIDYDCSTFDTDPFEPQSDGVNTIFPFMVNNRENGPQYVELPYTVVQDFTLFILLQQNNIDIWKNKVDWIAENGGMVLVNTHPDYMYFGEEKKRAEEYSVELYLALIKYVQERYAGKFWPALPRDVAIYIRKNFSK